MVLAELLRRKDVIETGAGGISNRFKIGRRRDVLFFEDILANYIKACERMGYKKDMRDIAKEWAFVYTKNFLPELMKRAPKIALLNTVMKKSWIYFGLLGDFKAVGKGGKVSFLTYSEAITRRIGENEFCKGLWEGVLCALYESRIDLLYAKQKQNVSEYIFSIKKTPFDMKSKDKKLYLELNSVPKGGEYLQKYLRQKIIMLKGNNLTYRGKSVVIGENTLFHLFGERGILMDHVVDISQSCFSDIVDTDSTEEKRVLMLKNLLRVFGWGRVNIVYEKDRISIEIRNPPYGIQKCEDNWDFLSHMILGYLLLFGKEFRISGFNKFKGGFRIDYSARK
jgi:hypothetical protein